MTKEVVLNLDEELIKKLDKQFKELGVDFNEGATIVLSTFVDDSEGFIVRQEVPKQRERIYKEPIGNQMTKSIAKALFERCGYYIEKPYTYASRGEVDKTNYDFYWANPSFDCLEKDWNIILNEKYQKKLTLLQVPKKSFTHNNMKSRTDKHLIDLRIRCDDNSYYDLGSGNYFKEYYICTIDYSDIANPKLIDR